MYRPRHFSSLLVLFFVVLMQLPSISRADLDAQTRRQESLLIKALVQAVRLEYNSAIHITERFLACFRDDKSWFEQYQVDLRDNYHLCPTRIRKMQKKVKENLSLMRIYKAISQRSSSLHYPDSYQVSYNEHEFFDFLGRSSLGALEANHILSPHIGHGTSIDVAPLTENEIRIGLQILNNDLAWIYFKYGGPKPSEPPLCFFPDKPVSSKKSFPPNQDISHLTPEEAVRFFKDGIGPVERKCYEEHYLALIFGTRGFEAKWINRHQKRPSDDLPFDLKAIEEVLNDFDAREDLSDEEIEQKKQEEYIGFPLLAYFETSKTSLASIADALQKRVELTRESKRDFEQRYYKMHTIYDRLETPGGIAYGQRKVLGPKVRLRLKDVRHLFIYKQLTDKLAAGHPEFVPLIEKGEKLLKRHQLIRTGLHVGLLFTAIPVCTSLFKLPLGQGLCLAPIGLGLGGYMAHHSETQLRKAIDDMLMSPNGLKTLAHMDSLSKYQFSRNIEWLTLPIGTGAVKVSKGFAELFK